MNHSQHVQLDPERCSGCHLCLDICPNELFEAGFTPNHSALFPVHMTDPDYCINCLRCVKICPEQALSAPEHAPLNLKGYVYGLSLKLHQWLYQK